MPLVFRKWHKGELVQSTKIFFNKSAAYSESQKYPVLQTLLFSPGGKIICLLHYYVEIVTFYSIIHIVAT